MNIETPQAVIVTASTRGVGFAVAARLVASGVNVVINGRSEASVNEALERLSKERSAAAAGQWVDGVAVDLNDSSCVERLWVPLVKHSCRLRSVFVNTPTPTIGLPETLTAGDWRQAVGALITFPDAVVRRACESLAATGGGSVVVNSSCSATVPVSDQFYLANTLRCVSLAQTKAYARRFARSGVRINALLTGYVDTDLTRAAARDVATQTGGSPGEVWASWEQTIPLGRLASPDEIATMAVFLMSDGASYVTGALIEIDGGLSTMHYNF